jgi:hypothetical protein
MQFLQSRISPATTVLPGPIAVSVVVLPRGDVDPAPASAVWGLGPSTKAGLSAGSIGQKCG